MGKLRIDPVDEVTAEQQDAADDEMAQAFDISNLNLADFKAVTI